MSKAYLIGAIGGLVSLGVLALGYQLGTSNTPAVVEAAVEQPEAEPQINEAKVEEIVRDYLISNPEILVEVQTALEAKREAEQKVAQLETITKASNIIFKASYDGIAGNPEGDVTVVEFFDYNCGFCKRAMADMDAMISADSKVRFVLKEFPILGPDSQKAHVVSMAFRALDPDQYAEFHRRLLNGPGRATEDRAIKIAVELGAEESALREEMKNPEISEAFAETYELANQLAITGTPSYVVGDEVVFGALGREVLTEKVANLRQCQSATC